MSRGAQSLKTVAKEAGVSVSAASYALRGAPNIAASTVEKVRAAAARLGYRPNARVAELMTHIRKGKPQGLVDTLGLVWVEGTSRAAKSSEFARLVVLGAEARAKLCGYRLESFWLSEVEGKSRRLADILRSRGIAGVVFGPVSVRATVELDWPWESFAMAVIGTAEWNAPLSRAAHHHFEAMRMAVAGLIRAGATRPGAWLDLTTNERAHRGWQAAWLAYGPHGGRGRLWLSEGRPTRAEVAAWLRDTKPDSVIINDPVQAERLRDAGWKGALSRLVLLDWRTSAGLAGVDQGYGIIAGNAVDLVVAQLQRNERGCPEPPRALLFPGRWREASERS